MDWKKKALIQNALSRLLSDLSYVPYYRAQRKLGHLRKIDPERRCREGLNIVKAIVKEG